MCQYFQRRPCNCNRLISGKLITIICNIISAMSWGIYLLSIENFCNEKGMIKVLEGILVVNCVLQTKATLFHSWQVGDALSYRCSTRLHDGLLSFASSHVLFWGCNCTQDARNATKMKLKTPLIIYLKIIRICDEQCIMIRFRKQKYACRFF